MGELQEAHQSDQSKSLARPPGGSAIMDGIPFEADLSLKINLMSSEAERAAGISQAKSCSPSHELGVDRRRE